MVKLLCKDVLSYNKLKKWATKFKHDIKKLENGPHPRRPVTVTNKGDH